MTNYDVIKKLIGPIFPTGCHSTDQNRLENLKEMIEVVDKLLTDMDDIVVENKEFHQESIKTIVKECSDFYDRLGIVE